ncbi:hypothetical protein ACOMHN_007040 [Nucella lapillus]
MTSAGRLGKKEEEEEGWVSQKEVVVERLTGFDIRKDGRLVALYPPDLHHSHTHSRRCAVLVPLFFAPATSPRAELHVLLTKRASSLSSHPGQVSFPGGAQDPSDHDDTHTALREAQEEVGMAPSDVTVVAHLPPALTRTMRCVFPVVGFIPHDFQPRPNTAEVERVFSVPLRKFVEKDEVTFQSFTMSGVSYRMPLLTHVAADGTQFVVWGLTCTICVAMAEAIFQRTDEALLAGEEQSPGGEDDGCSSRGKEDGNDEKMFAMMERLYRAGIITRSRM